MGVPLSFPKLPPLPLGKPPTRVGNHRPPPSSLGGLSLLPFFKRLPFSKPVPLTRFPKKIVSTFQGLGQGLAKGTRYP